MLINYTNNYLRQNFPTSSLPSILFMDNKTQRKQKYSQDRWLCLFRQHILLSKGTCINVLFQGNCIRKNISKFAWKYKVLPPMNEVLASLKMRTAVLLLLWPSPRRGLGTHPWWPKRLRGSTNQPRFHSTSDRDKQYYLWFPPLEEMLQRNYKLWKK